METNCYNVSETLIIVGSCLKEMEPNAFNDLKKISNNIYYVCLENIHLNMIITKIIGMISRTSINKIIFATVDKSPHCIQLHYIENEIKKAMNIKNIEIIHYVAVDDKLIEISEDTISKSKNLSELQKQVII